MKVQHLKTSEDVSRVKSRCRSDYNQKVCGAKVIAGGGGGGAGNDCKKQG